MTAATLLQQMREVNESFLGGRAGPLDPSGDPFIVLACIDPRLTGLLEAALGLPRNRAIVIRIAGNSIFENSHDILRSVAAAVYIRAAREVFVVGHTDCAMASFSAAAVADNFRKAGISRARFGDLDLREWFGAFSDVKRNVLQSIDVLRRSGLLPSCIKIHGLILGTQNGELEVVLNGDIPGEPVPAAAPAAEVRPEGQNVSSLEIDIPVEAPAATAQPPPLPSHPRTAKGPIVIPGPVSQQRPTVAPPASMLEAAMALREFIAKERQSPQLQGTLGELNKLLRTERNPTRILAAVEKMVSDYKSRYPELPVILEYLRKKIDTGGQASATFAEFTRRIIE